MRAKIVVMCEPLAIEPVGHCVCRFLAQLLLSVWFGTPRGSAREGGIHDVRVKVHPIHSEDPMTPRLSYSSTPAAEVLVPPSIYESLC
jgi:hypothetical protein